MVDSIHYIYKPNVCFNTRIGKIQQMNEQATMLKKTETGNVDPLSCCVHLDTCTQTCRRRPAETIWLTALSELRSLWGRKGRGDNELEKGWRSIRRQAEVSGVSPRGSHGFREACLSQLLLLHHLCMKLFRFAHEKRGMGMGLSHF